MRHQLHYIERDIAGNLGLAWLVEFRNWERFSLWLTFWTDERAAATTEALTP